MTNQSLPAAIGGPVTRAGLAVGCGGAGSLAALALTHLAHKASVPAVAAGAVTAALAVNAAASAFRSLAGAINALGNLLSSVIRARADAKATIIHAKVRADLARAGLDPHKAAQAAEMQRALSVNPDLPKDRRPADETLLKLHGPARLRSSTGEPIAGPDTPGNRSRNPKATASTVVVPIRSDT
jgi:hypothetical protein